MEHDAIHDHHSSATTRQWGAAVKAQNANMPGLQHQLLNIRRKIRGVQRATAAPCLAVAGERGTKPGPPVMMHLSATVCHATKAAAAGGAQEVDAAELLPGLCMHR